jgi:hypothetical protein
MVRRNVYVYDVRIRTCLDDEYENRKSFGEVFVFVVSEISK